MPAICVVCGACSSGSSLVEVVPKIKPQRKAVGIVAAVLAIFYKELGLVGEDVTDERPVRLLLPVCQSHASTSLAGLVVTCSMTRRVKITGVDSRFATAVRDLVADKWAKIAKQVDNS
ncbi:MAG: hypothetical protein KDB14_13440 [Planctomycetales bacterium]|nr:hypothetical protein [Planctomycetales bacterium]